MKKIFLTILAIMFVFFLYFTVKQLTTPVNKVVSRPVEVKTPKGNAEVTILKGKVESLALGNPAKKIRSAIVVADEKKQNVRFMVDSKASIYGKDGKATTLDKAANGDKVIVEYEVTSQGALKVKSIKLVE